MFHSRNRISGPVDDACRRNLYLLLTVLFITLDTLNVRLRARVRALDSPNVAKGPFQFKQNSTSHQAIASGFSILLALQVLIHQYIINMGCASSKHTIWRIDDNVHVALNRDKKNGNAPRQYTPRAPHPLLMPKRSANILVDDSTMKTSCCESEDNGETDRILDHAEAERLLYHTANHCDTIDPRDFVEAKFSRV